MAHHINGAADNGGGIIDRHGIDRDDPRAVTAAPNGDGTETGCQVGHLEWIQREVAGVVGADCDVSRGRGWLNGQSAAAGDTGAKRNIIAAERDRAGG